MSGAGEWEVVGRGRRAGAGAGAGGAPGGKPGKEKKKAGALEAGPKLEELFPPAQIKSMFAAMQADEEKKSGKEPKKKDTDKKKQLPKKQEQPEKKPEPSEKKAKPPKSVEGALQAIDASELANLINTNKARFANAPLVWLKEITSYLNSKTAVEVSDVVFTNQSVHYPMNIVPLEVRKTIESVLQEAGKQNTQLFYDITLTALANDMSRGQSAIGHKVLLQMVAQENPEFCVASIQKSISLRNSYQNRPPIGLSLLWSFGQGGFKNLAIGLQAWQELILPQIELRNYTKYIVTYLSKLLDKHVKMDSTRVSAEQMLNLFDLINSKRQGLSKEVSNDLIQQLSKIRKIYFTRNPGKLQVTFNQLLKKLPNQYLSSNNLDAFQKELVDTLVECLERDETCNATWRQLYQKCTKQSATLLHYIDSNWSTVSPRLKLGPLKASLLYFREQNAGKKDDVALKADKLCQNMANKMKKSTRKFPWLFASLLLFCGIIAAVVADVSLAGGVFSKSSTGKLLDSLGVREESEKVWQKSMAASARSYIWVETNAPIYYTQAAEFSKPYAELARDFYIIASKQVGKMYNNTRSYVEEKTPVVIAFIDQYAPGMIDSISGYACTGWTAVCRFTGVYYNSTKDYLHSRVFVGEWAPEILQDKTLKALNNTRLYVSQLYDSFHKQVDVYSKIQ